MKSELVTYTINITLRVYRKMRDELGEELDEGLFTIDNIKIYLLFRRWL